MDLYDIKHTPGSENNPGLKQRFWFARDEDIKTWPTLVENPSTADEKMKYSDNFTMNEGKRFYEGYMTWDEGGLTWELQGKTDCKSFKSQLEIFKPGCDTNTLALLSSIKNDNLVFIVDDRDDVMRVLGTEGISAKLDTGSGGTGKATGDEKGNRMIFITEGKAPPYEYEGTIPTTAASSESG